MDAGLNSSSRECHREPGLGNTMPSSGQQASGLGHGECPCSGGTVWAQGL